MTVTPTLLFGLGATKAATSWVHGYLARHPDCHLRAIKELHYFDCVESGRFGYQLRQQVRRMRRLAAAVADGQHASRKALRDVRAWNQVVKRQAEDPAAYLAYLTDGIGAGRLVADITPAYAELPEARLRAMAGLLPDVRFLYILRDPVARFWSHVRMVARRSLPLATPEAGVATILDRVLSGEPSEIPRRSDYAGALARMAAAIAPERLMVVFQDALLTVPGIADLCRFLGITPHPANLAQRVHAGVEVPMTGVQRARIAAFLAPQYEFVARTLGPLPDSWRRDGTEGVA